MASQSVKNIGRKKRFLIHYREKNQKNDITEQAKSENVKEYVGKDGDSIYKFRFVRSKFCKIMTAIFMLVVTAIFLFFFKSSSGSYLSAWYLSIACAILLLYIISIPRYIALKKSMIEVHGVLEITPISYIDIRRIYKIDRFRLRGVIPLIASYGFGGYYGLYLDIRQMKLIKFNATRLSNMIAIEDIYNEKHIISCEDPDLFVKIVRERVNNKKNSYVCPNVTDSDK